MKEVWELLLLQAEEGSNGTKQTVKIIISTYYYRFVTDVLNVTFKCLCLRHEDEQLVHTLGLHSGDVLFSFVQKIQAS